MRSSYEKVVIVGLGYVGLPMALLVARKKYKVVGIDINEEKIRAIKNKKSPFEDESIERQLKKSTLTVTSDFSSVRDADIIVLCVPTPVDESKMPDYGPVEGACRAIGPYLHKGQLIVLESTVNPGVCEELVVPILESASGLKVGPDLSLAHCPERINPGDKKWNVSNIPRVVGGFDKQSLERAHAFYKSVIRARIKSMGSLKEAEAVKIVENSFRNINIAFVNELAKSFSRMAIDVVNVINGAATKPFAFMAHYPGCGIGGHCIPVDPYYLIEYAKKTNGFSHDFLALACKTNENMELYTANLVGEQLAKQGKTIGNSRVAVLGLAYKKDIDDCRESPAFEIIKHLEYMGANVVRYDPHVPHCSDVATLDDALDGADAVVIATDHSEFRKLAPPIFARYNIETIVDGRNCLDKQSFVHAGINYVGIGR